MSEHTTPPPVATDAAAGLAAKLQLFRESLTPAERRALGAVLFGVGTELNTAVEDAAGYAVPISLLPLLAVKLREAADPRSPATRAP